MLQSVPVRGSGKPRLLCMFAQPTYIIIQVLGPNTLYIAETEQQLMMNNDDATIDALQLNQAGAPGGIYMFWWNGPLYGAGNQATNANFKPFIGIPNVDTGGLVVANRGAYGIEPTRGLEI